VKSLPVIARELASRDAEQAISAYIIEAGRDVALGFIDALEDAYEHIGANSAGSSPRWGQELNLAGLRSRKLKRYPYLVFFMVHEDHIDVWRILHAQRDIPAWLQNTEEE
jgi:toxin ParE1/3/4